MAAELVLAADQFIITPAGRIEEAARARAAGDEVRTVIAGYHWFTDWGRDTMISLEGLTLCTGRQREAGYILRTFGHYVRDGLIPNMFPEGTKEGLYHTADATLWFFHALHRYLQRDRRSRDAAAAAAEAEVDRRASRARARGSASASIRRTGCCGRARRATSSPGWTRRSTTGSSRRGAARPWRSTRSGTTRCRCWPDGCARRAIRWRRRWTSAPSARASRSTQRFWYGEGGYLYDVIDGEQGDDPSCRPNQIFAISLDHPVLDDARWQPVFDIVRERLLTPVGLRSLAPGHRDYKAQYYGDLRARDAAYHQGTVWALAHRPVRRRLAEGPSRRQRDEARRYLEGFGRHLDEAGIGTLSEIFDAEQPVHAARLHRPGLERRRSPARLDPDGRSSPDRTPDRAG